MLRAHERAVLDGGTLVLLGDVFEHWIEYRHLVPRAAPRLVGLVAEWCDRGAEVVYVVGNHDPWHLDFFERDVGTAVVAGAWETRRDGRALYIAHGDRDAPPLTPAARLSSRLQPLLRARPMARLYRMGLPGDAALAFARWTSRRFGTDGVVNTSLAAAMARTARQRLEGTDADVVAFGHSHQAALDVSDAGVYLNPGYWFGSRTFATVDADGPALWRWRDGAARPFDPPEATAASGAPAP